MRKEFLHYIKNFNKAIAVFAVIIATSFLTVFITGNPFKNGHNIAAVRVQGLHTW